MENKFTPGPWTFKHSSGAGLGIWADVSKVLSERYSSSNDVPVYHINEDTPKIQIAYELWTQFPRQEWDSMQRANGLLMAAAPDLLAALEAITDLYDTDEGCRSLPEYINARAAIAKARGETK